MTADIELLPLPKKKQLANPYAHSFGSVAAYGHTDDTLRDYARANVAHATAAKDAEIEALRAERDLFRAETIALAKDAERLAEALRFYADTNNWVGRFVTDPTTPAEEDGGDNARESLRDHDQETGNG